MTFATSLVAVQPLLYLAFFWGGYLTIACIALHLCDYQFALPTIIEETDRTMADYSKQTVAQLRQILKDRGIPSTGLTRKAQIIEKLEDADGALEATNAPEAGDDGADAPSDAAEQVDKEVDEKHVVPKVEAPGPALEEAGGM